MQLTCRVCNLNLDELIPPQKKETSWATLSLNTQTRIVNLSFVPRPRLQWLGGSGGVISHRFRVQSSWDGGRRSAVLVLYRFDAMAFETTATPSFEWFLGCWALLYRETKEVSVFRKFFRQIAHHQSRALPVPRRTAPKSLQCHSVYYPLIPWWSLYLFLQACMHSILPSCA